MTDEPRGVDGGDRGLLAGGGMGRPAGTRDKATPLALSAPRTAVVLALLGASMTALLVAPMVMPVDYSWIAHTTSESAAQGVTGAWVARTGFVAFGAAVLVLSPAWSGWARALHTVFGGCMVAAAVYSSKPWTGVVHDGTEDMLHSVAATTMGFAFAGGVAAVAWARVASGKRVTVLDTVAVVAAVVLPLAMVARPSAAGVWQRVMFAIAYLWYAVDAVRAGAVGRSRLEPSRR